MKKFDIFVDVPDLIDQSQRQIDLAIFIGILSYIYKNHCVIQTYSLAVSLYQGVFIIIKFIVCSNDKFSKIEKFYGTVVMVILKNLSDLKCIFDI